MESSEKSTQVEYPAGALLRQFGKEKFKTMSKFAQALGMPPQSLQSYLNDKRKPGLKVLGKLKELGFDVAKIAGGDVVNSTRVECSTPSHHIKPLGILLLNRSPDDLAEDVDATSAEVKSWISGEAQPSHEQLVLLFNELAKVAAALVPAHATFSQMEGEGESERLTA